MFNVSFKTSNAAFDDGDAPYEVARILREIAAQVEGGRSSGSAVDLNGNSVGSWSLED